MRLPSETARSLFPNTRILSPAFVLAALVALPGAAAAAGDGVVTVPSVYALDETIARIKADIADKGILFFADIDQGALAEKAGVEVRPSHLLLFGNPPLGAQFLTSNPDAGLDWPVRLLVREEADGSVVAVYSDFAWIAHRFDIKDRGPQFVMASEVIGSITNSVKAK